jgi:hypothetical protein
MIVGAKGAHVMPRLFISYSRRDSDRIDRLASRLHAGGHTVFVDRDGLTGGDLWRERVLEAIDRADVVLLAVSKASVASAQVRREIEIAQERDTTIVPLMLEKLDNLGPLRHHLSGIHRIDFFKDFEAGIEALLKSLRTIARRHGADPDADDVDTEAKERYDKILEDPEMSTQEKIRRYMKAYGEDQAATPSARREAALKLRQTEIDREIALTFDLSPDDPSFTPHFMTGEDHLPPSVQKRLSALRLERREITNEILTLVDARSSRMTESMSRKADSLLQRYDRLINRILKPDE